MKLLINSIFKKRFTYFFLILFPKLLFSQGITLFKDFAQYINTPPSVKELTIWKDSLYYSGYEYWGSGWRINLWRTDGTIQNNFRLMDANITKLVPGTDYLLISGTFPSTSNESKLVITKDGINSIQVPDIHTVSNTFVQNDTFYVNAYNQNLIRGIYRIIPSENTVSVQKINGLPDNLFVKQFKYFNNKIYFTANSNGYMNLYQISDTNAYNIRTNVHKIEVIDEKLYIYTYNGYTGNMLKGSPNNYGGINFSFINSYPPHGYIGMGYVYHMFKFKGKLYFNSTIPPTGSELYYIENDTIKIVQDIYSNTDSYNTAQTVNILGAINDKLLFSSTDGLNNPVSALWATDGINPPQRLLENFYFADSEVEDDNYKSVIFQNRIFFLGFKYATGNELWVTDGTANGTKLIQDLNIGTANSTPTGLTVINGKLFFVAFTPEVGRELWYLDPICKSLQTVSGIANSDVNALDFIHSIQTIPTNSKINYKSQKAITLSSGFNTQEGCVFQTDLNYGCQY